MDRRKDNRLSFQSGIEVVLEDTRAVEALRPNISWGGIGFFTRDQLPETGSVKIRITFQNREGGLQHETIRGRLAWARQEGNFTAAGISFDGIDRETEPLLFAYLQYAEQFG